MLGRLNLAHEIAADVLDWADQIRAPGWRGYALRVLGEALHRQEPRSADAAEQAYREALALGKSQGMRPLEARCRLGLGLLSRDLGRLNEARAELLTATSMLTEMGMVFWLPEAEAALAEVAR